MAQPERIRQAMLEGRRRFYAMDWGFKTPYAVVYGELYGQGLADGEEKENAGSQESSVEIAARVAEHMAAEGVTVCAAGCSIWENKGGTGTAAESFLDAGIDMVKAYKRHREARFQKMQNLMKFRDEFGTPYLRFFRQCKYTIREAENIQRGKRNLEVPDSKMADHGIDAISYGIASEMYDSGTERERRGVDTGKRKVPGYTFDPFISGSYYNPNIGVSLSGRRF